MPFRCGEIVGDYEILGALGRGGMGAVYRVRNVVSHRIEAMKELLPEVSRGDDRTERFLREIRVHAALQHPHIAQLFTAFRWEDRLLMVMELVEGESLEAMLRRGPLAPGDAAAGAAQVLEALEYAHGRGVVHRDIKPSNVVVLPGSGVKLLDFGIARSGEDHRLTLSGMVVGSLAYMSPEQVAGQTVDGRSDLYSLGLTLYEAITGMQAIRGESQYALMQAQLSHVPEPPAAVDRRIPAGLSDAIMRAVEKDRERRFQTAAEFRAALERFCAAEPGAVAPQPDRIPSAALVDSAALETIARELARSLGPIARRLVEARSRTATSPEQLYRELAAEIPSAADRAAFLDACRRRTGGTSTTGAALDVQLIERARKELAGYVGPMAKVIVDRALRRARTESDFLTLLGGEIEEPGGRERFLAAMRRPGPRPHR